MKPDKVVTTAILGRNAQALAALAARIGVVEKDGFVEITVDGEPVYGFTTEAIDDKASQAVRQFGEICRAIGPAAQAFDLIIQALRLATPVVERVAATPVRPSKRHMLKGAIEARTLIDRAFDAIGEPVDASHGPAPLPRR